MAQDPPDEARARFEALAAEVVEPVRRFLVRRTDRDTAEDVLAETLLVCWRRVEEVPDLPLPWVYAVARNCLHNAERAARRQDRVAARIMAQPVDPGPPDDPALHRALGELRAEEAELVRLWAWEQLTPAEIAVVLGISPNAASSRLTRARKKLSDGLRKSGAAAGHEGSREGRRS